jgi:hypothetical protein
MKQGALVIDSPLPNAPRTQTHIPAGPADIAAGAAPPVRPGMYLLELVPVPVSDVNLAKAFYAGQLGFHVAVDIRPGDDGVRVIQLTRAFGLLDGALADADTLGMASIAGRIQVLRTTLADRKASAGRAIDAPAPEAYKNLFRREGQYWTVCYQGSVARLTDAKGLRLLARLLADPGREFHAVDLEAADAQAQRPAPAPVRDAADRDELPVRADLGDAGDLLDATAKAAYKARLGELQAELEEAERCNDPGRAAKAGTERDFLVAELARAVGLGGRDRRAASPAERARLNVTRAIRTAMANLARANPPLGRHLAATIRTGRYCSYTPDPRVPITWGL